MPPEQVLAQRQVQVQERALVQLQVPEPELQPAQEVVQPQQEQVPEELQARESEA